MAKPWLWMLSLGLGLSALALSAPAEKRQLCGEIYWISEPVDLDSFHRRMICGDPDTRAWRDIPLYQARTHLTAFLQTRGYATPVMTFENNQLLVDRGPVLRVEKTQSNPENLALNDTLLRYRKRTVTPELLNLVEGTGKAFHRNQGYPCASTTSQIDVHSGALTVISSLGERRRFNHVAIDANSAFNAELLRRYYSFTADDEFHLDDLTLTRQRIDESEVVSGSYFITRCDDADRAEDPYLEHKYVLGMPRTFRFGFGADTETGPYVYAGWKNNRFTQNLGQLGVNAVASFEKQTLNAEGSFYPSVATPRFYYSVLPSIAHDTSTGIEEIRAAVGFTPGYVWEFREESLRLEGGPYFIRTWHRPEGETVFQRDLSVALKLDLYLLAHAYEIKKNHPEAGYTLSTKLEYRSPLLGFFTNLLRAELDYKKVWRLGYCSLAECFLAFRHNAQVNLADRNVPLDQIPPSLQTFLGDVRTLRGFDVTNSLNPGLTQVSAGVDLRVQPFAWPKFEPYLLADVGKSGRRPLELGPDLLYSVGVGLRWLSPIGIVNGFFARAFTEASTIPDQWYYFIGLGEGF